VSTWLLVDGFNLAFRCHYAVQGLTRSDGFPTNAVYGWMRSLWRFEDEEKPAGLAIFYDLGGSAAREALHPSYKANRSPMPEDLERQIPVLKEIAAALGLPGIEEAGVESDDLLASHAVHLAAQGHDVRIVSGDKDFAQLVNDRIQLLVPPPSAAAGAGWKRLDAAGVKEKFGVPPRLVADWLALVGDTVDNIPGLDGVGPKTAAKWLERFPGLEEVIAHASLLQPARLAPQVSAEAERLRLNLRLTLLQTDLPVRLLERRPVDAARLFDLVASLEMRSHLAEARKRYEPQLF
jgi:DNA polymerase-1